MMPNRGRGGRGGGGEREERAEGVRRREEVCITANIKNVGQPTGKISLSLLNTSNLVIAPPPFITHSLVLKLRLQQQNFQILLILLRNFLGYCKHTSDLQRTYLYSTSTVALKGHVMSFFVIWTLRKLYRNTLSILRNCKDRVEVAYYGGLYS